MKHNTLIWIIISTASLIFEMNSPGLFFFLSFAFGGLAASISSMLNFSLTIQLTIFLSASITSFFILKILIKKSIAKDNYYSNYEALPKQTALVLKTIPKNQTGQVKLNGEIWSAKSWNNKEIKSGNMVKIIKVKGCHLIVEEIKP